MPAQNPDSIGGGTRGRYGADTKKRARRMLATGMQYSEISRALGPNPQTIAKWARAWAKEQATNTGSKDAKIARWNDPLPPPLLPEQMGWEARDCLDDFERWRYRYLGRRSTPWQVIAAEEVVNRILSPDTEFIVMNEPPGSGKSTLFTHDIPAWLICRDRTIRILLGHSVARMAMQYSTQLRRTLQRTRPLRAGYGREDATGCLAVDYGRFRPTYNDSWRAEEFTVMMNIDDDSLDESGLESKEPTVASYGFGSEYLGARANYVAWDDLVTDDSVRTIQKIEDQRRSWDIEGETRVEPGGCLLLNGQRIAADDLFRYALNQTYELHPGKEDYVPRYTHIVFPAHDDEHCRGDAYHELTSPAWDGTDTGGCLLDPQRLRWHGSNGLNSLRKNKPSVYEIQYQQRDVSVADILIPEHWIHGGQDEDGTVYHGAWDEWRSLGDIPRGLAQPYYSIVTVDPSATNYWSIQWWIYHEASYQRFLVEFHHQRMIAADLLDWNASDDIFYGVLNEMVERSQKTLAPITHLIVEANACQRWLLTFDHTKRWQRKFGVQIIAHATTGTNKLDPELGIQGLRTPYQLQQVRLPGKTDADRATVNELVYEATRYRPSMPKAIPDDALMAQWFLEWNLQTLTRVPRAKPPKVKRPTWLNRS